jgi:3-dehydroquinate dehydratase / shikimate dehydrogenase
LELSVIAKNKICAVVAAATSRAMWQQLESALQDRHSARHRGEKTIELRLDWLEDNREIARFLRKLAAAKLQAAMIATFRRRQAGGKYRGSIGQQLAHLAEAVRAGCRWYDLEIESIRECPPKLLDALLGEASRIASAHFFAKVPRDLGRVAAELDRSRSEAIKIAARCESLAEGLKLLRLGRQRGDFIGIPMSESALPLRVLAMRHNSALSYAPVENATAPGQVSFDEMRNVYRADSIDRRTRVYGIIGDPVAHSLSPAIQNAAFQARRINAIYLPFLVSDLRDFIGAIEPLGIAGFSVTIPHKQAILRYLDDCDPLAAAIGAVNTVVVRAPGKLYGCNTDYVGVLRALEPFIPLRGSRVLILGAGGAARAVAFALAQAGAAVSIAARRKSRAAALAKAIQGQAIEFKHLRVANRPREKHEFFDAIINATPVGMHPRVHDSPLDARDLNCRLVFDTIYRPQETKLLRLAARRGIETVSGVEMFLAQGTAQFEIWTGERAPAQLMRKVAQQALADQQQK